MEILKLDGFNNIYYIEPFPKEWQELFKNDKKSEERYSGWLDNKLRILDENPIFFTRCHQSFEYVDNSKPQICSIHQRSKKNPRALYYLLIDKNKAVLLTPFLEKSKSDYKLAVSRAEQRVKKLLKGE